MKKKGFTLVELLGVITVLAMILLIAVPNITRTLQRNSENDYKHFIEELELATETYLQNNKSSYPELSEVGGAVSIRMDELINYGVVDSNLINPQTKEKIKINDVIIARKNEDGILKYEFLVANREELKIIGTKDVIRIQEGDSYDFLEGVSALDGDNNPLSNITVSIEDSTSLTVGMYDLVYEVKKEENTFRQNTKVIVEKTYTFDYINASKEFPIQADGDYVIELWGAQGAASSSKGAYTAGTISLKQGNTLHVYVGQGNYATTNVTSFNGGTGNSGGYPGGGATDVRLVGGSWNDFESLKSRIMIAAGSGSGAGNNTIEKGYGGKLTGGAGGGTQGGTQTSAGARQSTSYTNSGFGTANGGCAGGGGYYGGGASTCANGAGGGSSFISGYTGCDAIKEESTSTNIIHTGQPNHYSGLVFKNMVMKAGNEEMPTHDGNETMVGNDGNGYAKIKYIGE